MNAHTPIKNVLTPSYKLSFLVAILLTIISLAGAIFRETIYPTEEMRYSSIATNLVNLFIVLLILLDSIELARRDTLIGLLFWPAYCSLLPITFIRMQYEKLTGDRLGESSETIRECIQTVCEFQLERF